jgi:hypothetical protein
LATLLAWNTQDPRDDFEMNRNNYIYTWQQNRNPFIDYPLLANYVFGPQYGQPWFASLANSILNTDEIKIFPNPASEYIFISGIETPTRILIYTLSGQKVLQQELSTDGKISLNLPAGIYFINMKSEEKTETKKIIVK